MGKVITENFYYEVISKFHKQKALVVGDLMVDKYVIGEVRRISPEAPVQIVNVIGEEQYPGGAGNVVRNLITLEAKVDVMSVIGFDDPGEWLTRKFGEFGVDTSMLFIDKLRPTTLKERIMVNHQQILRIDREERIPISWTHENAMKALIHEKIESYDVIFISDYDKGMLTEHLVQTVVAVARAAGKKPVIVDPKGIEWMKYCYSSVISPNEDELAAMYRVIFRTEMVGEKRIDQIGHYILEMLKLKAILITKGEKGMVLFEKDGPESKILKHVIHTRAKDVFDVTGAGDTALSVFGLSIAVGADYFSAAHLANIAAGIVVSKVGTSAVRREEMMDAIQKS